MRRARIALMAPALVSALLALLCCVVFVSAGRPLNEWSSADLVSFLRASPAALSRYAHTFDGVDGRMLDAMSDAQVSMFLEDDSQAFEVFLHRIKEARAGTATPAPAAEASEAKSSSNKHNVPPKAPATVMSTEEAGSPWTTQASQAEAASLLKLQQEARPAFESLARNPTRCSALLPTSEMQLLQQLQLQLTRPPTPQNLQDASDEPVEELLIGGCTRMVPGAIEAASTKAPRKLVMVLGSLRAEERHALRGSIRPDQRGSLTILSFGANLTAVDSDPLPALELAVDPLRGACAAYHMGLSPEVVFVNGHKWLEQALRLSREGPRFAHTELDGFCGCEDWIRMWSSVPDLALVGQSADVSAPSTLSSLAVRSFGQQRVVMDAPCWGRATPSAAEGDAAASAVALSVAGSAPAADALTCNDTLSSSALPADAPLIAGLMVVEQSRSWDATAARISASLESFGPHIDTLLVLHLADASAGMEAQSQVHSLITEETRAFPNLRFSRVLHLPFAAEPFANNFARARNAGLCILAGRGDDAALAAKIGHAVFVLHMDPQDRLVHGAALRATLESQRHLCGPSASLMRLSVVTNGTTSSLEARVFRRSALLHPSWEPDYPAGQDMGSYVSSSAERFVNWGLEALEPPVRFGSTGPAAARTETMTEAESAGLAPASAGCAFIVRALVAAPVDKLMRDVGLLLAQEAELRAKIAWWFEHRYKSATDGTIAPVPQRWLHLLQHTHSALALRYEQNRQIPEAYEYYLQTLEAQMASPRDAGFNVDEATMAAVAEGLNRVLLAAPQSRAGSARALEDDRSDVWSSQRCNALFKLLTLHSSLPALDVLEADSSLRAALERSGTDAEATAKLLSYYRAEFLARCGEASSGAARLEPLYLQLQALAAEQRWLDAAMTIASSPLQLQHPLFAQKIGRNTAWWCPFDSTVCQGKLVALIQTIQKQAAK